MAFFKLPPSPRFNALFPLVLVLILLVFGPWTAYAVPVISCSTSDPSISPRPTRVLESMSPLVYTATLIDSDASFSLDLLANLDSNANLDCPANGETGSTVSARSIDVTSGLDLALRVDDANASSDQPDDAQGDDRSIWDLVSSCLATIFACTWVAAHPNVRGYYPPTPKSDAKSDDGEKDQWMQRAELMFWGVMAPEIVVIWAYRQWVGARDIKRIVEERMRVMKENDPTCEFIPWTLTHSQFLQMGGYIFKRKGGGPVTYLNFPPMELTPTQVAACNAHPEGRPYVTWARESQAAVDTLIRRLLVRGQPPRPLDEAHCDTEASLEDRSKVDGLSKAYAVTQTLWFVVQCIGRRWQHLHVTELELATVGYAVLNGIIYALWWYKPADVACPIVVEFSIEEDGQGEASPEVGPVREPAESGSRNENQAAKEAEAEAEPQPQAEADATTVEDLSEASSDVQEPTSQNTNQPEATSQLSGAQPQDAQEAENDADRTLSLAQVASPVISRLSQDAPSANGTATSKLPWYLRIREAILDFLDPMRLFFYKAERKIRDTIIWQFGEQSKIFKIYTDVVSRWNLLARLLTSIVFTIVLLPTIFLIRLRTIMESTLVGIRPFITNPFTDSVNPVTRFPTFCAHDPTSSSSFSPSTQRTQKNIALFFVGPLLGAVVGAVHCAAWANEFPGDVHRELWRAASAVLVAAPLVVPLVAVWVRVLRGVVGVVQGWRRARRGTTQNGEAGSIELQPTRGRDGSARTGTGGDDTQIPILERIIDMGTNYIIIPAFLIYVPARIILLVLSGVELGYLPESARREVSWESFIPHWGSG